MSILSLQRYDKRQKLVVAAALCGFVVLIAVGAMARNGWLPHTDSLTGKKTGWFGKELPKNAKSSWNPFSAPAPNPTPQLSKSYVYAGSRLLTVEDVNASASPPADLAIWRPSTGVWWVLRAEGQLQISGTWGLNGDTPVPGDYDGDGITDFSIFRPSTGAWWVYKSSDGQNYAISWGVSSDQTAQADYDGDGKTDAAVFRANDPSSGLGTWYILKSSDSTWTGGQFGVSSDLPASADYDGDGRADIGVWRASNTTFYSLNSSNSSVQIISINPNSGNKIVSSDYDGDGKADYGIYDSTTATWHVRQSSNGQIVNQQWGAVNDIHVENDYDADGKTDIAVWHDANGTWAIRNSHDNSTRIVQWGMHEDIPVPAFYKR
jgi:hypothetical protein